jgi:hypothetical protein
MSEKKKKKLQSDTLKAGVMAALEEAAYQLDFIIDTVTNSTNLSHSGCAREGLSITLRDLQVRIGGIRSSVAVVA